MNTKVYTAPDISCEHCAMAIKRELGELKGISEVVVDVASKRIQLEYSNVEILSKAVALLAEIGYPVSS